MILIINTIVRSYPAKEKLSKDIENILVYLNENPFLTSLSQFDHFRIIWFC